MDWPQIALRILHIGSGILWVGGAAAFFITTSTITVLGGLILYRRDSNGLQLAWITSPTGIGFTIGSLAAIAAWLSGGFFIRPAVARVAALGAEIKGAGGPPTPDLLARMHEATEALRRIGLIDLVLLAVAVVAMASARYLA